MHDLFIAFFALVAIGAAQSNQAGSVAIAGHIHSEEVTMPKFSECVASLVKAEVSTKQAIGACTKVIGVVAKTNTRIANEAADATKASRPVIVDNYGYGGYGYGGYYGGGGYGGRTYYPPQTYAPTYHTETYHTPTYSK